MKLVELMEETYPQVLAKMASTVGGGDFEYTDRSCFGKVAHYLKQHPVTSGYVMLFGFKGSSEVTHCCLYTNDGQSVVDTFDGQPSNINGNIVYVDKDNQHHELLYSMPVARFMSRFVGQFGKI